MLTRAPILGTMRFGSWGARLGPREVAALVESALDAGIDTLDLADIYGDHTTNALVGDALALHDGLRARVRLVAKVGIVTARSPGNRRGAQHYDLSVAHLRGALDASLRALRTDRVEMLMLHRFDPLLDAGAIAEWIRAEQAAGRVVGFGVSNFGAQALARFDGLLEVSAHQLELSVSRSAALQDGSVDASRSRGAGVQAWSPLGGGALLQRQDGRDSLQAAVQSLGGEFGLDAAALLLRWVASVPGTRVVLGTTRADRIAAAAQACARPLPRDAWYALWEAARGAPVP